jgi:hypothetical protein
MYLPGLNYWGINKFRYHTIYRLKVSFCLTEIENFLPLFLLDIRGILRYG